MPAGIVNIVFGGIMIAGGLSGKLSLLGTNSPEMLAVVGGVVLGLGVYQSIKSKSEK